MVIQHNISAMNATRQLGLGTGSLAKATEKLSCGYKINRAADDAAGLSISEKMRKQIRGLNQASENIEDGISLCQIADGALNETVDILQRMRELAVQSANGTNSASDRQSIEMEIIQLRSEVDRIAETTKFNNVVYPLNAPVIQLDADCEAAKTSSIVFYEQTVTVKVYELGGGGFFDGKYYNPGDTVSLTGITISDCSYVLVDGFSGLWLYKDVNVPYDPGSSLTYSLKKSDLKVDEDGHIYYDSKSSGDKMYVLYNTEIPLDVIFSSGVSYYVNEKGYQYFTADNLKDTSKSAAKQYATLYDSVSVHASASSTQTNKIPICTVNATCKGLGIAGLSVVTEECSTKALKQLDTALLRALKYRSTFGAVQNRLEHAEKIDDNTAEDTQAAETRIRDADMAAEMIRYYNADILAQAGRSMLAQANQNRQSILSLIV